MFGLRSGQLLDNNTAPLTLQQQGNLVSNILTAIVNISNSSFSMPNVRAGKNTINTVGKALEVYIQNVFVGEEEPSEVFSYLGNQNNPPDLILKGGDAVEVKKIESKNGGIALNSSYPKHKLHSDDPRIKDACRKCEAWTVKDIIYAVGVTKDRNLKNLWLVYGDCYAADREVYTRIARTIEQGITQTPDVEFANTKELGRVNRVDPLGITYLRIRGMWGIENPRNVFSYLHKMNEDSTFSLACLMRTSKYNSFTQSDRVALDNVPNLKVKDVELKNPNNPAQLLDAKLITLEIL